MFLITEKRKHGTNLCIVQSYRDPVTKKSKTKRIRNIGYLEELQKEYDDPIAHFREVARKMSEEYTAEAKPVQVALDPAKSLEPGIDLVKNLGYTALSALYHDLKLDVFFERRQRSLEIDYNLNSVMKLLVYGRILYPGSKRQLYEKKGLFFDKMDFSLNDLYRSYTYFHRYKTQMQTWIDARIRENYGRDIRKMYCYESNHYFETDEPERTGSNNGNGSRRSDPIVQMGLFVDKNGLPVSYELFPRNNDDVLPLSLALKKRACELGAGKVIFVADNSINNADNLYYLLSSGNGYIVSQSIRNAGEDIKQYVLNPGGYVPFGEEGRVKSRLCTREVRITTANGKKKTVTFKERQIVYHNGMYARCARMERGDVLLKAKDLIAYPDKYNKSNVYGAARYVQNLEFDEKTGEVIRGKHSLHLDEERLQEEERYDGYYLILTSEIDEGVEDIIGAYSGLWEIEGAFRSINSNFRARPDFVSRMDHMQTHFLTCFVSFVLTRILEMKIQRQYPLDRILESLRKCNCVHIEGNHYIQSYYDAVLNLIGESIGVDFSKRYGTLYKIRENIGSTKKRQ